MNSKEAFEEINNHIDLLYGNNIEALSIIEKDLETLEKYRDLFEKIKKSEQDLEYSGEELIRYYNEIEGE